jgi:hypothetical protein
MHESGSVRSKIVANQPYLRPMSFMPVSLHIYRNFSITNNDYFTSGAKQTYEILLTIVPCAPCTLYKFAYKAYTNGNKKGQLYPPVTADELNYIDTDMYCQLPCLFIVGYGLEPQIWGSLK